MRKTLLFLLLFTCTALLGQEFSPERTGGVYYAYPVSESARIAIPQGYEPFYLSHYGRHGSRWLPSQERYDWVMAQFDDDGNLTPLGLSVKQRLKKVCRNARGHAGALTPLGARQHRGIARRMAANYPELFAAGTSIQARSSTSPRCRASMLAFLEGLPVKGISAETRPEDMAYINHESAELKALTARTQRRPLVSPGRLIASLFRTSPYRNDGDALRLLSELHTIASDMQDIPLNVNLFDIFTPQELLAAHDANNERMTICNGDTVANGGIAARSSIPLWQNIVSEADAMIASGGHGASLRFGHDTALYRLLTLLGISLPGPGMEDIVPMGANLQMVFLKRKEESGKWKEESGKWNEESDILVAFLLNENPVALTTTESDLFPLSTFHFPLSTFHFPLSTHHSPLYRWSDVKAMMTERLHLLEHQRQLLSLNTMVGTAQANTRTAGLFGKGSEEKGQTLPAVLVPNGQTFWTPQTRDTERKCIAPYYYADTLFQGIRASHWLVGGCTQDYGSFTVLPFRPGSDGGAVPSATPFSHAAELSHPHYYGVLLPREQLLVELTGLSHSAILRLTPQTDGPVAIVVRSNSDEEQGGVSIDPRRRQVSAFNPVHRIYQGWGEPAGFSGHLVLRYTDEPVGCDTLPQALVLTFNGQRGRAIELRMATSFTSREGAERNLLAEAEGKTFGQMEQQCMDRWLQRLHTIDVSDPDTARVDQFYGALYRASFLPREMSDADGAYPRFADGTPSTLHPSPSTRYGDFSMWDTYRALHPLLCLIAPKESGEMMQSLVGMAEEGGWLPIFPCWNSYTAAMIGDHCTSVLADAYVKGIRSFDAAKAYAYMRRNAFRQPESYDEYKNGMGRRALDSYLRLGYIPLEDSVREAFHQQEQTSRTLEYAYDDFCVAQMARGLRAEGAELSGISLSEDEEELLRRSENWRHVINPLTGYADGRHADGRWLGNGDLVSRQPYITEGATCHYTWYVPQNIPGLISLMGGRERFVQKLDTLFAEGRYWHGNEPCHQVAWLYSLAGEPAKTRQHVGHILSTEYNNTPGGLSGNDDAGQMSAWQVFASLGFYPVCPATPQYVLGGAWFQQATLHLPGARAPFVIQRSPDGTYRLNGRQLGDTYVITHDDLLGGGTLMLP